MSKTLYRTACKIVRSGGTPKIEITNIVIQERGNIRSISKIKVEK